MKTRDPVIIIGLLCFLITVFRKGVAPICRAGVLWYPSGSSGCLQPRVRLKSWWLLENLIKSKEEQLQEPGEGHRQ